MTDSIGKQLAKARYRKGWSRRQVVEAASNRISETGLRNIEKGYSEPLPQTVYIIAEALEIDADPLLQAATA